MKKRATKLVLAKETVKDLDAVRLQDAPGASGICQSWYCDIPTLTCQSYPAAIYK